MSEIVQYEAPAPARTSALDEDIRLATALAKSGFYKDIRDAAQGIVKLMIAREMGLGMRGISDVHIVEGKPTLSYQLILSRVRMFTGAHGTDRYDFRYARRDDECVEIEWLINGEVVGASKCDSEDAKRMGLAGRGTWQKYPRQMRTARAVTEGVNAFMPEVMGGAIYTPDELGDESAIVAPTSLGSGAEDNTGGAATSSTSRPTLSLKPVEQPADKAEEIVEAEPVVEDAEPAVEAEPVEEDEDMRMAWAEAARKHFAAAGPNKKQWAESLRLHGYLPEGKLTASKIYDTLSYTLGARCLELDVVIGELDG